MPSSSSAPRGDLAYKKIFPALQAMVRRGKLDVPVIGVAKSGWNLDQLKARAQDSLDQHGATGPGGVRQALLAAALHRRRLPRPGHLRPAAAGARRRQAAAALPGHPAQHVRHGRRGPGRRRAAPRTPASSWKSPSAAIWPRPRSSTARCTASSPSRPSSASTTTSARNRCRT